jgi:hypothetical protein
MESKKVGAGRVKIGCLPHGTVAAFPVNIRVQAIIIKPEGDKYEHPYADHESGG